MSQWPSIVNESLLFSSVTLKTELVASKEVTPNNHLPSSTEFIGGLNEKFPFANSF